MTEREALKLALEAFEHFYSYGYDRVMCEKAIIEIKEALAQPELELLAWKNAALRVGEDLSSIGPNGYYNMTAQQWLDWAMAQQPRGNNSLAQPEQERCEYCKRGLKTMCLCGMKAQPEQEPVIGTKTWFEDGKIVTQHLTAKDIYKEPEQIPPSAYSNTHQPEQEPLAWFRYESFYEYRNQLARCTKDCIGAFPVYTAPPQGIYYTPPQRTWVGLTKAQCGVLWKTNMTPFEYYQAIEDKLKEKNTRNGGCL